VVLKPAEAIVAEPTGYLRTRRAVPATLAALLQGQTGGTFLLSKPESNWLDRLSRQAEQLPEDEGGFIEKIVAGLDRQELRLGQYGTDLQNTGDHTHAAIDLAVEKQTAVKAEPWMPCGPGPLGSASSQDRVT
jgi:hypothetical protein